MTYSPSIAPLRSDAPPPFIVYALPRSRTFWLSKFLSYGEWSCGHEELVILSTPEDVRLALSVPATGSVETMAAPFWRTVQKLRPDIRTVIVRRPVEQCIGSAMRVTGCAFDRGALAARLRRLDAKLNQIAARVPGALCVNFESLNDPDVCHQVFEHCLPYKFDPAWWNIHRSINLQCNLPALMRRVESRRSVLSRLASITKQLTLIDIVRHPVGADSVTFQEEPLANHPDALPLMREHGAIVGKDGDGSPGKNMELMQKLEDAGSLQIMTARSSGRLLAYLVMIIGPSLERRGEQCGHTTFFFSSHDAPTGTGMRLLRASVEALRAKGIQDASFRADPRDDHRIAVLFRRLGAKPAGELYRVGLDGT